MLDLSDFVIRGRVWKFGDSVDTNVIAPLHVMRKGEIEEIAQHTMAAVRPEFPAQVRPGDIIVAGANFGCGSHREEANRVLEKVGIRAIVADSVARIFLRTSINLAYPTLVAPGVTSLVEEHDELEIDYPRGAIRNLRSGRELALPKYPASVEQIFAAGGILTLLKQRCIRDGLVRL
ncbi:MAG: 3-isopropylmalate dehydratase small subunit [Deltaproteobacteria bacterium]|nr:3-isopropylmalate dehydratase small subunit [Deltaproteobacteria bacterium]MBI2228958.1 3-isopropylmalate dehydratase small subunit [Deltaproteobacteria bacterium]MBI2534651.1 3-isopropylmalate dehydratase small subunit [Deltaproteobacteria bacterium]